MKLTSVYIPALLSVLLLQGCAAGVIAAAGTTASVNSDERSISQQIDDDSLSIKAIDTIVNLDVYRQDMRINIVTNNSYILLIGQVPDQLASNRFEYVLSNLEGVKGVYNQLRINQPTGVIQQTRDSWITTKVKSQLTSHEAINPFKIKVITENGEVFLIGRVTEAMSNYATNVTRKISGVKQVIRVFDIIPANKK